MINYRLVNNWLTVKTEAGVKVRQITPEEKVTFKELVEAGDEEALIAFMDPYYALRKKWEGKENIEILNGQVCVKGIPIPVPEKLLEQMDEFNEECLLNFWTLAALNPNEEARDKLLEYVERNGYYITKNGMLVTFRRANGQKDAVINGMDINDRMMAFVLKQHAKVKAWKKAPSNYQIWARGTEYLMLPVDTDPLEGDVLVGNMADIYTDIMEDKTSIATKELEDVDKIYWAQHGGTDPFYFDGLEVDSQEVGGTYYAINHETRLDRRYCDESSEHACSAGLHTGTPDFVNGGGFGSNILVCLINPADVCAIPYSDMHKMRSAALYPIAEITQEELTNFDYSAAEYVDHEYAAMSKDIIKDMIEEGVFILPEMLDDEAVIDLLSQINPVIEQRVVEIS